MIVRGSRIEKDYELRTDVVVIGSGAGGAVVARELAEAGAEVVVLEEGRYVEPHVYGAWKATETFRYMARSAGSTVAFGVGDSPTVNILAGSAVGGSSVLTGGVCFRIPEAVHETWTKDLGMPSLSEAHFRPFYERVEREIHVETVPESMRSRSTVLFGEGARKLGYELKPLQRNTKGCCGCSQCNFGCPHGAKLSVDLTYLPRARELGTRILAEHRVDRLLMEGDRVVGVEGRTLDTASREPRRRFTIRAETVVICAGALHSPLVLMRSGLKGRSGQVGRNLTLHPAFRAMGVFDEEVRGWRGAMQSAYSDAFEDRKLTFVSAYAPINVTATPMPGVGAEFMKRVRSSAHVATFGGMVHDDANGRVWRGFGREPFLTYRMSRSDKAAMVECLRILGETFLAAGAREVMLPIFGSTPFASKKAIDDVVNERLKAPLVESVAFHPLGTCRMGPSADTSVVSPEGRVWGTKNLWIADGSVLPTSVGVNTQVPVMAMATRIAAELLEARARAGRSAA